MGERFEPWLAGSPNKGEYAMPLCYNVLDIIGSIWRVKELSVSGYIYIDEKYLAMSSNVTDTSCLCKC